MTKTDREVIAEIIGQLEEAFAKLEEIGNKLQDDYDSKSEKWQDGDAGQKCLNESTTCADAANELEEVFSKLSDIINEES